MRGLARELVKGGKYVVFSIDYRWINKLDGETTLVYMHQLIEAVKSGITFPAARTKLFSKLLLFNRVRSISFTRHGKTTRNFSNILPFRI